MTASVSPPASPEGSLSFVNDQIAAVKAAVRSTSTTTIIMAAIGTVVAIFMVATAVYVLRRRRSGRAPASQVKAKAAAVVKHEDLEFASVSASSASGSDVTIEMPESPRVGKHDDLELASVSASGVSVEMLESPRVEREELPESPNGALSPSMRTSAVASLAQTSKPATTQPLTAVTSNTSTASNTLSAESASASLASASLASTKDGIETVAAGSIVTFEAGPLGLGLGDRDGLVKVTSVDAGMAADALGVEVDAIVREVGGQPTDGLNMKAVIALIKVASRPLDVKLEMPHATSSTKSPSQPAGKANALSEAREAPKALSHTKDKIETLKELANLKEMGVLTEVEFQSEKAKVLNAAPEPASPEDEPMSPRSRRISVAGDI